MSYSYVILTEAFPTSEYMLDGSNVLKIIKANPIMFNGTYLEEKNNGVLLALPHIDNESYRVYNDLITFHSFISGDFFTYTFAETVNNSRYNDSELVFLNNVAKKDYPKVYFVDFDTYPLLTSENIDDEFKSQPIQYGKAFQLFRDLRNNDGTRNLYDQIRLFVYASTLEETNRIYKNTYMSLSFYVTILESIIGKPPECNEPLVCSKCGATISKHLIKSLEEHFKEHFPTIPRKARYIRHGTYHKAKYYDLIESSIDIFEDYLAARSLDGTSEKSAKEVFDVEVALSYQVYNELTNIFINLYQELNTQ